MKKIILVHGWGGSPKDNWFPWLKKELKKKGFQVKALIMPNTDEPKIAKWVPFLKKHVLKLDKNTYFVGHSIGCQTIMRYLEKSKGKINGMVFVAPWFTLKNLEPEEKPLAKPWLDTPINYKSVLKHTNKVFAIFSDNDPVVPVDNIKLFRNKLGAKIIIEKKKGHFEGKKYPPILKAVLELVNQSH